MTLQANPTLPPSSQPQLDYAPAPPRHRKYVRRAALLLFIVVIIFVTWRWGRTLRDRIVMLYAQHQCLTYGPSPDMVVYEEEPTAAAKLLASSSEYSPCPLNRSSTHDPKVAVTGASHTPACWPRLGVGFTPWGFVAGKPGSNPAVIFLHERTSPAGHRRLVCVDYFPEAGSFMPGFLDDYNIHGMAIVPATWNTNPKVIPAGPVMIDVLSGFPSHPPNVRVYAGQIDPSDPSKFTIRYQMWGQTDILDGQLMDDDEVQFKPRHTPDWPR